MYRNPMRPDVKLRNYKTSRLNARSRGYILITLMLFITLLAMAAVAVLPEIMQQIRRDREEEMIHRAVGYSRAIRKYYKKFGRYPARIEELENTNQMRFLRKRYQDPITGKDFKLVRVGDPALNMLGFGGIGQGVGQVPGQTPGPGGGPGFVASPTGGVRPAGPGDANTPQVTGLPDQQNSGTPTPPAGGNAGNSETEVDAKSASSSSDSGPGFGGQVFGGGPILGVASVSKATTIREFNRKNHYNDWLFIYDPTSDRGGMLNAPVQPDLNKGLGGAPVGAPAVPPNTGPGGQGVQPQQPGPPTGQQPPEE
jgi:type II secretory pathway pseudopilin PulG